MPQPRQPDSLLIPLPLPRRLHTRLAAWADSRLLPVVCVALLALDAGMGLNWLIAPPSRLSSPAYSAAQQLASMTVYGAAMVVGVALAAAAALAFGRSWWTGWAIGSLLAGQWLFWTVCFTLAPIGTDGASYAGAVFAAPLCVLHVIAGLALTHQPVPGSRRRA